MAYVKPFRIALKSALNNKKPTAGGAFLAVGFGFFGFRLLA